MIVPAAPGPRAYNAARETGTTPDARASGVQADYLASAGFAAAGLASAGAALSAGLASMAFMSPPFFMSASATTWPPLSVHSFSEAASVQPSPLQEFWPLQALPAPAHEPWPLQ